MGSDAPQTRLSPMDIIKQETGTWHVMHEGVCYGGIWSDQPASGIAQNRIYTADIRPNLEAHGFRHTGSLQSCKKFIQNWSKIFGWS